MLPECEWESHLDMRVKLVLHRQKATLVAWNTKFIHTKVHHHLLRIIGFN